jgi:aarF domain-containing kinase
MILKLSDLQRSLDASLATTHGQYRVYIIIGEFCAKAGKFKHKSKPQSPQLPTDGTVWQNAVADFKREWRTHGLSAHLFTNLARAWLARAYYDAFFGTLELGMDFTARIRKVGLWVHGFRKGGLQAAAQEMAGLRVA